MITVGRVCMKTAGREAGKLCCVVKTLEGGMVLVTGPPQLTQVRRRKCNIAHLEPLPETLDIKPDATDQDVLQAFQSSPLLEQLQIKPFPAEELKKRAQWKEQKAKARAQREAEAKKLKDALQKKQDEERRKAEVAKEKKAKPAKPKESKAEKPKEGKEKPTPKETPPAQPTEAQPSQHPAQPMAPAPA